jgi:hypothetical protein
MLNVIAQIYLDESRLSLDDCRRLFPLICRAGTTRAHQIVAEYLADSKSPLH